MHKELLMKLVIRKISLFSICLKVIVKGNFTSFCLSFQMAGAYDTEQQRMIDRIKYITFREARDAAATYINRQWIADRIHRASRFFSE